VARAEKTLRARAANQAVKRLNWGCGEHIARGWINSDVKNGVGVDLVCDIREGLTLENDSIDYVVSVHALPELAYPEVLPALRELRRVLKPGGVLRLVLPDLRKAIRAYHLEKDNYFKVGKDEVQSFGGRFITHVLWYGHSRTLFTADFIEELLGRAGFVGVTPCSYRHTVSGIAEIIELDNREDESLYVEATNPLSSDAGGRIQVYNSPMPKRAVLQILEVSRAEHTGDDLRGFNLDLPQSGTQLDSTSLTIIGWAVGRESRATVVEVVSDGAVIGSTPIEMERPGVAKRFQDVPGSNAAGFKLAINASGTGESELLLRTVLENDVRVPIALVRVKVAPRGRLNLLRR
jgi:SAM-dependent methyltransferase